MKTKAFHLVVLVLALCGAGVADAAWRMKWLTAASLLAKAWQPSFR